MDVKSPDAGPQHRTTGDHAAPVRVHLVPRHWDHLPVGIYGRLGERRLVSLHSLLAEVFQLFVRWHVSEVTTIGVIAGTSGIVRLSL